MPTINEGVEPALHKYLRNKVIKTPGTIFHAIGGIEDHIHLAVAVKPTVDMDGWIGQLKGASSHEMGKSLQWQHGYGVVSFGTKDLQWVVNYVLKQKEHHRRGTTRDRLERTDDEDS